MARNPLHIIVIVVVVNSVRSNMTCESENPLDRSIFAWVSRDCDIRADDTGKPIMRVASSSILATCFLHCFRYWTMSSIMLHMCNFLRTLLFLSLSSLVKSKSRLENLLCAASSFFLYLLLKLQTSGPCLRAAFDVTQT